MLDNGLEAIETIEKSSVKKQLQRWQRPQKAKLQLFHLEGQIFCWHYSLSIEGQKIL